MRRLSLLLVVSLATACGVFGADDPEPGASPPDPSGGVDAGRDSADPVGNEVPSDSFLIEPVAPTSITRGSTAKVKVTVKRGKDRKDPITIVARGLRDGITGAPLTITETSGDLEITVPEAAPQGAANGLLEGTAGGKTVTAPLAISVRGKPGEIDTAFGTDGFVKGLFGAGNDCRIEDLALDPKDDSVYVVATCRDQNFEAYVVHVAANGTVDKAYGTNGMGHLTFKSPHAAALQSDGKLVVVGGFGPATTVIGRLDATGKPDTTFGDNSVGPGTTQKAAGGLNGQAHGSYALALRSDGDIFVSFDNYDTAQNKFLTGVMHLDPAGSFRTGFGASGTVRWGIGFMTAMLVRNDPASPSKGNLLMAWAGGELNTAYHSIMQINGDTSGADTQFGSAPKPITVPYANREPGLAGAGLVELPDGSVITAFDGGGVNLRKFTATGAPAVGFGANGLAGPFPGDRATGMALQADGKVLVALAHEGGQEAIRFTSAGTIDTSFGQNGRVTKVFGTNSLGRKVVVQKSGRILLSGVTFSPVDGTLTAYWP